MEKQRDDDHKYYLLRRTLLVILSLSLLPLLFHYLPGVSIFPYNSLTHAFERKYVFLFCNVILAFLVKTLAISSEESTISDESLVREREETCVEQGIQQQEEEVEYSKANKYSGSEIEESGLSTTLEDEDEEEEELMSTEELNRKVEEFIRKMKEDIRVEAQQPLIAV